MSWKHLVEYYRVMVMKVILLFQELSKSKGPTLLKEVDDYEGEIETATFNKWKDFNWKKC